MERVKTLNVPGSAEACPEFFAALSSWQATGRVCGFQNLFVGCEEDLEGRLAVARRIPPGPHLLLPTSGSSSARPRLVILSQRALKASADATNEVLSGPGDWTLLLPLAHIAGLQVALRALDSGKTPTVPSSWPKVDLAATGRALAAESATKQRPAYTSLVSAQLARLLREDEDVLDGFRSLDAVLVGGGHLDQGLIEAARAARLRVVTTYGMTETAGGCVYDGLPLPGTRLSFDDSSQILISSSSLMDGYLDQETRWQRMDGGLFWESGDLGKIGESGLLEVTGRADSTVKSGGVKVDLARVERVLADHEGVVEAACIGVPDPEWGHLVGAVVVAKPEVLPMQLHLSLRESLGTAHAPRVIVFSAELPRSALGKVRRAQLSSLIAEELREGRAWTAAR